MNRLERIVREAHRRSLWQVLAIYVVGAWIVYQVIGTLWETLGLPDWVPGVAVILFLIGLPMVLATAFVQEGVPGRQRTPSPRETPALDRAAEPGPLDSARDERPAPERPATPNRRSIKSVLTWNRAITVGVLAFALLGLGATGFMGMRWLGIGPAATLVSAGVLDAREPILLADFAGRGIDTLLTAAATEALRVDLEQSSVVRLYEADKVGAALARMEREPGTLLDEGLARELAQREGLKAVILGEINAVGASYVLTARLVSTGDGKVLASYRDAADDDAAVIAAVDRLSNKLREKVGESLKTIRAGEPLEQVTTASLDALKKYSQALRVLNSDPDPDRGIALLEETVALDSTFAMAWRKLGVSYSNRGDRGDRGRWFEGLTRAYELRDRLSDRERYHAIGMYAANVEGDAEQAINAYRTLLDAYPDDHTALHNLANQYSGRGEQERAAELYHRAIAADSGAPTTYRNLFYELRQIAHFDEADELLAVYRQRWPEHPQTTRMAIEQLEARGEWDASEQRLREWREQTRTTPAWFANTTAQLATVLRIRGRYRESEALREETVGMQERLGQTGRALWIAIGIGFDHAVDRRDAQAARRVVADALRSYPPEALPVLDRPYTLLAHLYALLGHREQALRYLDRFENEVRPQLPRRTTPFLDAHFVAGFLALHDGRREDAIREFRTATSEPDSCQICNAAQMAIVFDEAGQPDSARVQYERVVTDPAANATAGTWWLPNGNWLPRAFERLGQLYDERGESDKAAEYYASFVELWEDADPELQPRVDAARQRLQELVRQRG